MPPPPQARPFSGSSVRPLVHLLFLLAAPTAGLAAGPALRLAGTISGDGAEIVLRGLPRADAEFALSEAWAVLAGAESELSASIEQIVRQGTPAAPELGGLLARCDSFCQWSDGALSVLGAPIYRLWERGEAAGRPTMAALDPALADARCERMSYDTVTRKVDLVAGTVLDFRHFIRGWAVDRAAEALSRRGAADFLVRLGAVARGVGPGPEGRGWPHQAALGPHQDESVGTILLRDQAVAVALPGERPIRIGGESYSRLVDLRSGKPATGVVAVLAVTELAADAEPLAAALAVLGPHGGQLRLGVLKPKPAALWLLGQGEGSAPVLTTYNWSAVRKR